MPRSKWDKAVAAATKQRCLLVGMTKDEVEKTLGKPAEATNYSSADIGDNWTYTEVDDKKCVKYSGDNCIEHEKHKRIIFFSPNGHVTLSDTSETCYKEPFFSRYYLQFGN